MEEKQSLLSFIEAAQAEGVRFGAFCLTMQAAQLECTETYLRERLLERLTVMRQAVQVGLEGRRSHGGLTGGDAKRLSEAANVPGWRAPAGGNAHLALVYALAVAEANAGMGRIVAAPTAGSCGVLPGVLCSLAETYALSEDELAEALAVAGVIGMVIASRATLSGAEGGCQAECGAAASMAAGAAVALLGGSNAAVGEAAAMAMKNMLGLVCDPVAGLVEVPCVKRNAGAAMTALAAAEMALAGIKSVIPADEVFDSMGEIGAAMACEYRETAAGGLAVTPTGKRLQQMLEKNTLVK